jgi:hypothetical protein
MKTYTFETSGKTYNIEAENLTAALTELRRRVAAGE